MKVLQIVQKSQRRGAEIFAHDLSGALLKKDYKARTLYLYPLNGYEGIPLRDGDRECRGNEGSLLERVPGVHPGLLKKVSALISEFDPDVVQVNGGRSVKYGAFAKRFRRKGKWALVYRNIGNPADWVSTPLHRWYYQNLVMPEVDGIVSVSKEFIRTLKTMYGNGRITECIPRGVSTERFVPDGARSNLRSELGITEDQSVAVSVGSLTPEKRIDRLLRVVSRIRESGKDLVLWVLGDGPLRADLEEMTEGLALTKSVRFLGVQSDVAEYMKEADIFLLSSDTEGTPGVLLEAGLMELPVVTARVGGVHECVVEDKTGCLVDAQDEDGFVEAVSRLIGDPAKGKSMGKSARQHVMENFSLEKISLRYMDFYQRVIEETSRKAENARL